MITSWARMTILLLLCWTGAAACRADAIPGAPLRAAELLSLVAGNVLPENVAHEIASAGLAFRPDVPYRALLKTAGADSKILAALDAAKVSVQRTPEADAGKDMLQHLANAGNFLNAERYNEATRELTAAVTSDPGSPECAFVMGQVLRQKEQWQPAEALYEELLHQAPNFRAARTKLSYVAYRTENFEKALQAAKAALRQDPEDAEAHKNAGLALMSMGKYDTAEEECRAALRLKPDYAAVHYDVH
jgi:tetratricopeptide (TPR) repeat protein